MFSPKRLAASLSLSALFLAAATGVHAAPGQASMDHAQVKVVKVAKFGEILVNGKNQALYYWDKEKNSKPACFGKCAAVWPPATLAKSMMAPTKVTGAMGTFSVVMRPDGAHQLAYKGHPLYTFVQDVKPLQVLCDGVDGWHVVRVMAAMH